MVNIDKIYGLADSIFEQLYAFGKGMPSEEAYMNAYRWACNRLKNADHNFMLTVCYFSITKHPQECDSMFLMDSKKTLFGRKYLYLAIMQADHPEIIA